MAITVYGADWCPKTAATLRHLDKLGMQYRFIDIERDAKAAEWVRKNNEARSASPRSISMA